VQSRSNLALSWGMGDWTTALSFYRKGSRVSFDGNDRLPAWTLANLIVEKEFSRSHSLSLVLRNAFDKKPPIDTSRIEWPYYDRSQYDAIGRELYLEYRYAY
ncbi:MAG: TonB-dependent receptor, partial [Gammaproteobacteria bacterium]|nr:TonB-dependent receptor [Gammaproteobacteria bacterium]